MGYVIEHSGKEYETFAQMNGGRLFICLRSDDTWTGFAKNGEMPCWEKAGVEFGLLSEERDAKGFLKSCKNVHIAYLPPIVVTPAVLDGDVIKVPPVLDDRICINLMLVGPALKQTGSDETLCRHQELLLDWMKEGRDALLANNSEDGKTKGGLTILDPTTFSSPSLVWAA